jgi:hypothetical protein
MSSSKSRPHVVYRIYGEDEFLRGGGAESFGSAEAELGGCNDLEAHDDRTHAPGAAAQRLRRLAGIAMLLGAVGFAGGAILRSGVRPSRSTADRQSDPSEVRGYAAAAPQVAAERRLTVASGTSARSGSSGDARRRGPARRLFTRIGAASRRRHWHQYHTRDGDIHQPSAVDRRLQVDRDTARARPVVAPLPDARAAATEAAGAKSATVVSPPARSPTGESPTPESHAEALTNAAHSVATATASAPRQMEFGFER